LSLFLLIKKLVLVFSNLLRDEFNKYKYRSNEACQMVEAGGEK